MSSNDIAVSVRELTKTYRIFGRPGDRLKQAMTFGFKRYHKEFIALKEVSFDIKKGETIGIVGRNGSGKSTLLQLICGILKPTSGVIKTNGRVSALLELGAGFNPEFTGRENVYFQGALRGLKKKDIDECFDDIEAFADIGEFIDQPVRTYSNGMFVRLAFAALIHADADILVVDEALAVGDEAYQRKCFERLEDMFRQRKMVLFFVSHNIRQIERMCSRVFLLEQGRIHLDGPSSDVCNAYHSQILKDVHAQQLSATSLGNFTSSGELDVLEISMFRPGEKDDTVEIEMHAPARISVRFKCHSVLKSPEIIIGFHTTDSIYVASTSSAVLPERRDFDMGEHCIECVVPDMMLVPGVYHIRLAFLDSRRRSMWDGHRLHTFRIVPDPNTNVMRMPQMTLVDMPFTWHFNGIGTNDR